MSRLLAFAFVLSVAAAFAQPASLDGLKAHIEREVKAKNIPALSIAIVDDQKIVWSAGFGYADEKKTKPATAETIYRVGSVSKLFTDLAIVKLAEDKQLDLDAPVSKYLPEFEPNNPFDKTEITLRHLMAHRSGLIRESPVGNYFDDTNPTLEATVKSLKGIDLVYAPGARIKYSNAAIAAVGRVLEVTQKQPFAEYLKGSTLDPLGMANSSFAPTKAIDAARADAVMWTYHGREFPAPTFPLGMAPAGSMDTTVDDLAKFLHMAFAGGKVGGKPFIKAESLEQMFSLQFAKPEDKQGFGLGFVVGELDGKKRVGHGGAIYGFATELAMLPGEKLGAIVTCSRDVANGLTTRLADDALRTMLAIKAKKDVPKYEATKPLLPGEAEKQAGRYVDSATSKFFDLTASEGKLFVWPGRGGLRSELRLDGEALRPDDCMTYGPRFERVQGGFKIGEATYAKVDPPKAAPAAPPKAMLGLIGEYGWDHNVLFIYEQVGKLYALIEWVCFYPLTAIDGDTYAFPDHGLYHGEKLIFRRDRSGRATEVEAAKVVFKRRKIDGENGETFKIVPQKPIAELRVEAMKSTPPDEKGEFRKPELVDLATVSDTIKFDIRYATKNNFLGEAVYSKSKAFLQKPAAEALGKVHADLKDRGYGLLVYDAYRPWHITKIFWDATPVKLRNFVADPAKGSRHNRGCAVDLGLYELKTGEPIEMVSGYDEFGDRAAVDYTGGTSRQRWYRDLLRRAMERRGFAVYEAEWWHYDFADWSKYPLGNVAFDELK